MEPHQSDVEPSPGPEAWVGPARRGEFGAHLEANYQRLVGQLYAMTLNPAEAHELVHEAYALAWREWSTVGRLPDPAAWVRSFAVRSIDRGWRGLRGRLGMDRSVQVPLNSIPGGAPSAALLGALGEMPSRARRTVVLHHMAGLTCAEIALVEGTPESVVQARLAYGRDVVIDALAQPAELDYVPGGGYG